MTDLKSLIRLIRTETGPNEQGTELNVRQLAAAACDWISELKLT